MTDALITLTALGCALALLVALNHWLYLERQWWRIQLRRHNQLVNARAALSQRRRSQPVAPITINSIATPEPTDVIAKHTGDAWEDWLSLAEYSANGSGLRTPT